MIMSLLNKLKRPPDQPKPLPSKALTPPHIPSFAMVYDSSGTPCVTWEYQTKNFRDTFLHFASEIEITTLPSGIPEHTVYRLSPQVPGLKVVWQYKSSGWDTSVMIHGS